MNDAVDRTRLRELIAERKTTARAISLRVSSNQTLVRDILRGQSKNPRLDTLQNIAEALDVPLGAFLSGASSVSAHRPSRLIAAKFLSVRYRVQAGLWREPESEEPPEEDTSLPVLPLPRYGEYPQWLEKVEGDSADRRIPEGFYIHVIDALEMGYTPKHDDWVVVVRERDQGAVRERSVKQIEITAQGAIKLWPRSTNPRWSAAVDFGAGTREREEDVTVTIVGKVVGSYDPNFSD